MNILAHYILSQREEEVVVGNIIADFIKGYDITLFPEGIRKGIQLHKKIDIYSDNHPVVRESWSILQKDFGHYGRVITDIYYDHFLIKHWKEYSDYSFQNDLEYLYQCLNRHTVSFPPKIRRLTTRIVAMQWPLKYTDMTGLYHVFRSMSRRVAFENNFELAVNVLQQEYETLESHFCRFFPDLKEYAQQELEILSSKQ
jgi:acyl carrier protein phosphodiesterase